jgi:DNA polymerase-3 subunit alpha
MQIANEVGGFTMGQADILRKAMGKKDPELLEQQREKFVAGAKHHAISSKLANSIFSNMAKFGSYGFNKSHSAGYAVITYRTAWLKANHPLEFMTSLLNGEIGDSVKMAEYIEEAERMNIWVLPPDIHESRAEMSVVGNDILFGLAAIKNVGTGAIQNILEVRKEGPFENLFDFCRRVDLHVVNKKMIESLIKSGAFDCFERPRSQLYAAMDEAMDQASKLQKLHEDGQLSIFSKVEHTGISADEEAIASLPEWPDTKLLAYEREMIGVYRSGHPLENSRELLSYYVTATTNQADDLSEGEEYWFGGFLEQIERKSTRKGGKMGVALFEDPMGRIETIFFPKVYELCSNLLKTGEILFIRGRIDRREEKVKLIASEVATLNTISEKNNRKLQLDLNTSSFSEDLMKELRDLFVKYRGNCMILFLLRREQAGSVRVVLPRYPVSIHPELLFALEQRKEINEIKVI